ncbi:MAG: segregation/condensation protein A [Myxococcota bacterium]
MLPRRRRPDVPAPVPQDLPDESPPPSEDAPAASPMAPGAAEHPDAPLPLDPNFRIQLPGFEGPLDLLLYLIKKHALDIEDLPIAFVTSKYVEYLKLFETLNLDVASEYLVMAATLAHIKSKTLLPTPPPEDEDDDEDELDPRAELIRRLLEYQKYKQVAERLGARGIAGRDVFFRGAPAPRADGPAPLAETSVFKLIDAFQSIVAKKKGELAFAIDAERITIQQRMGQITDRLRRGGRQPFESLFDGYATTYDLVVTFLALLEMAKMRMMRLTQDGSGDMVFVEVRMLADAAQGAPDGPEGTP